MTHTPGPWTESAAIDGVIHADNLEGEIVVVCIVGDKYDPMTARNRADCALIMAAPDMLDALRMVMRHGRIDDSERRLNQVAAAIAKAEGRS